MVDRRLINETFRQNDENSCILSSYGVVTHYFTRAPVTAVFEGYCKHFGIHYNSLIEAETLSTNHLLETCKFKNWGGYDMVQFLHNYSPEETFVNNSNKFNILFTIRYPFDEHDHAVPPPIATLCYLKKELEDQESLLNTLYTVPGGWHSLTVGISEIDNVKKEFFHNTGGEHRINICERITKLNADIREWIAYRKRESED